MRKLGAVLVAAVVASAVSAQTAAPELDHTAQAQAISQASALLRQNYVDPALAESAAQRIAQVNAAGDYASLRDPSRFAARVSQDLQAVTHDPHLAMIARVDAAAGPAPPRTNGGFSRVDRLKGNIGYVKLDRFPPLGMFTPFADQAMRQLAGADALVIDLRDNEGGAAASVTYFASFFFAERTHLEDLVSRTPGTTETTVTSLWTVKTPAPYVAKPVYLLTSSKTFSGGEELADDLQAQKRALVVGAATAGGANAGSSWPILDGRLRLFVPSSRAENPITKANWAGSGVQPDVIADAEHAFGAAVAQVAAKLALRSAERARLGPDLKPDNLVEAHLLALRNSPQPRAEPVLRRLIGELVTGAPNYAEMGGDIAAATRRVLPRMQADLIRLGEVKSISFRGVGPTGGDEFDVQHANGSAIWMLYQSPEGRVAAFAFNPSPGS